VDGEPLVVHWEKGGAGWVHRSAVRLWWRDGKVAQIRDYVHVDCLLEHSRIETEPWGATVDQAAARGREV